MNYQEATKQSTLAMEVKLILASESDSNESQVLDRMATLPALTGDQQSVNPTSKIHLCQG